MTSAKTEQLERFLDRVRRASQAYAKAVAYYEWKEHQRKIVLAFAMKSAESDGFAAVGAQEREARASKEYSAFLDELRDARVEMELARGELDVLKMAASLRQSQLAMERTEVQAYGST